jgi:hypothetical protein
MSFNGRILVIHPAAYYLGHCVVILALIVITIGVVTHFKGEFLMPAKAWFAAAIPTAGIGGVLIVSSVTRL